MKKLLLLMSLAFLSLSIQAQDAPYLKKSFDASNVHNVKVRTADGNVLVTGGAEASAKVEVYIRASNGRNGSISKEEIEERLENYTLRVEMEGNTLICYAKSNSPINWKEGLDISFKVLVPNQINTEVKSSDGNLSLKNLEGNLNFSTSDGNMSLTSLHGKIVGRTSDGNITANDMSDNIELSTSDGNVYVQDAEGLVQLKTSDGFLRLERITGKISGKTSDGDISVTDLSGKMRFSTSDGNLTLNNISGSLEAKTSDGDIAANFMDVEEHILIRTGDGNVEINMPLKKGLDLDLHGSRVSMELKNFDGSFGKNRIVGSLNGGGIEVNISTGDGNIDINK